MKTKNLTIQEAIKSGKPFRRSGGTRWYGACEDDSGLYLDLYAKSGRERTNLASKISSAVLMATDWEIKVEPKVYYRAFHPASGISQFYETRHEAESASHWNTGSYVTKFVEVIDD